MEFNAETLRGRDALLLDVFSTNGASSLSPDIGPLAIQLRANGSFYSSLGRNVSAGPGTQFHFESSAERRG
ncbi:MAG: hypothetical protein ACK4UN_10515, partial [Limisphaerales bacterium]